VGSSKESVLFSKCNLSASYKKSSSKTQRFNKVTVKFIRGGTRGLGGRKKEKRFLFPMQEMAAKTQNVVLNS
jgi:hypothetical protein